MSRDELVRKNSTSVDINFISNDPDEGFVTRNA